MIPGAILGAIALTPVPPLDLLVPFTLTLSPQPGSELGATGKRSTDPAAGVAKGIRVVGRHAAITQVEVQEVALVDLAYYRQQAAAGEPRPDHLPITENAEHPRAPQDCRVSRDLVVAPGNFERGGPA